MNKTIHCPKCDQTKPESEFNKGTSPHGFHTYCRECQREYEREYWRTRKDRYPTWKARADEREEWLLNFLIDYLLAHPCVDCGETDPVVLQFDHVRGEKNFNVSEMFAARRPLKAIKAEIEKCEVRCANCHAIKTAYENGYWLLEYIE